jgi:hypothetical protein
MSSDLPDSVPNETALTGANAPGKAEVARAAKARAPVPSAPNCGVRGRGSGDVQHLCVLPVVLAGASRAGGHQHLEAVQVGGGDEQVQRPRRRDERAVGGGVDVPDRAHEQLRHALALER